MADKENNSSFEVTSVSTGQKIKPQAPAQKTAGATRTAMRTGATRTSAQRTSETTRPTRANVGVESVRPARESAGATRTSVQRTSEATRPTRSSVGVESVRPARESAGATRTSAQRTSEATRPTRANVGVESVRPARESAGATRTSVQRTSEATRSTRANVGVESVRPARESAGATRPGATRMRAETENAASTVRRRRIADNSGNQYRQDKEQERIEKIRDEKQRERYMRRKEIEEASAIFTKSDKPRNYFINLMVVTFKMVLVCMLIIGISGVGFIIGMAQSYLESVPELDFDSVAEQEQSTVLLDSKGNTLGNYYNMENREWAELDEIPLDLQNAVIAIEDVRFRRHMGIDFKRLVGAVFSNLTSDSMQGGSTITQQLIKNTMLSFDQTYKRKIQEASLALELEQKYEKDDILEAYLNTIYMGGSCYGVKTAAKDYFGKELSELTLRECACLAGMIQNPSRYNPRTNYYSRNNPARTDNRTNLVLYEMWENGIISKETYEQAKADTITVLQDSPYSTKSGMVYFTDYVIDSVVEQILIDRGLENNSKNRNQVRKEIRTEGYTIYTTMDEAKQRAAEEETYNFKGYPTMRYSADSYTVVGRNPDGSVIRLVQPQAAVAVVDYHNGHIIALVGGRQAPTGSLEFNRSYQSTMPVGSSIKPIAVYAPAIERGSGIGTVYYDQQIKINGWGSVKGYPENNSRTYAGWVTMKESFTHSLNTGAAQALLYDVGIEESFNTLVSLGVDPDHISKTGSGLALGSSGITPLEMAGAFSAIANMGVYIEPIAFTKVVDKTGNVIVDMVARQDKHRVFSESTAWQTTYLMREVALGLPTRIKVPGQTVYGKTGTNSEQRGVFFAGFTGYYTCCAWVGSDAYKQLQSNAQGSSFAAPLFSAVMTALHKGLPDKAYSDVEPETIGVMEVNYCSVTGKLATEACSKTHVAYGNPSNMNVCDLHRQVEICSASGALATANCPEETRQKSTLVMIPEKGIFNYMYYNQYNWFVSTAGTPVTNMSNCKVHQSQ